MKNFIAIIIISLFVFNLQAQFGYGVKGGLTLSHMNLSIPERYTTSLSYGGHIGFYVKTGELDDILSFQPELMFIQKGTRVNDDFTGNYMYATLNYIDLSLLARASTLIGNQDVYFTFGPYVGVLLSDSYNTKEIIESEIALRNGLLDAGIVFSMGFELGKIILEARVCTGLVNVGEKTDNDYTDDSRNNYANFTFGYIIK